MDKQRLGVPGSVSWQRKEMKPESDEELRKPDLPLAAYDGGPKPQLHELGPLEDVGCTDIPRDSSFSRVVCCLWLEGKCKRKGWHVNDRKLCLHEDVPGIPCGFGDNCKYHHFKTRTSSLPWADPLSQKPAFQKVLHSRLQEADLPHLASDGGPKPPLHELGGLEGVRCTDIAEDTSISCGSGAHALSTKVSVVCCLWLEGKCWRKGQHVHGKKLFLHEDVPGMACGFGSICKYHHFKTRTPSLADPLSQEPTVQKALQSRPVQNQSDGDPLPRTEVLHVGMMALIKAASVWGEVMEISHSPLQAAAPVHVRYGGTKMQTGWFSVHELQIADYSCLMEGTRVTVRHESGPFYCTVKGVSAESRRARRPVEVHYEGYGSEDDEWVGADRLRSRAIQFLQPKMPAQHAIEDLEDQDEAETSGGDSGGPALQRRMVVLVKRKGGVLRGEVLQVSSDTEAAALVQVWSDSSTSEPASWLGVKSLQVPDYSAFEVGLQVGVVAGGKVYLATVLQMSSDGTSRASPVRVRYNGYTADHDEWVGAERLRSKALNLIEPSMPRASPNPELSPSTQGNNVLHVGMIVCNSDSLVCGEVLEVSSAAERAKAPVKVRQSTTKTHSAWFPVEKLRLPDYSGLCVGMHVTVLSDGTPYLCTVLEISGRRGRSKQPVRVNYSGYTSKDDEWVGPDRLRSKHVKLVHVSLPSTPSRTEPVETRRPSIPTVKIAEPRRSGPELSLSGSAAAQSAESLPWDEEGSDHENAARGLDSAVEAVDAALTAESHPAVLKRDLEKDLRATLGTAHVRKVLVQHGWTGSGFPQTPDLETLKQQLSLAKAELHELESQGSCSEDVSDEAEQQLFDVASSCAADCKDPETRAQHV